MDFEMTCGRCESHIAVSIDDPNETTAASSLAMRFANAHVECGYMTKGVPDDAVVTPDETHYIKRIGIAEDLDGE